MLDPINPYQAYNQIPSSQLVNPNGLRRSILTQIRVISILLIIHGVLLLLVGLLYSVMTFVMPPILANQNKQFQPPNGPPPEQMETIMIVVYGLMGAAGILPGLLQIVAGISNLTLKGRTLGIVALLVGLASVATCYCTPTAIGLGVYGMIIYFNENAVKAFALAADGKSMAEIEQMAS